MLPLLLAAAIQAVDIEAVRATGDPAAAIHTVTPPDNPPTLNCDILVAGAGAGGFAAAIRAADRGHTVCLTEETNWIGGQITAGGVSALDEHKFIEFAGATRTYYQLRQGIRDFYRARYSIKNETDAFNPGSCYVSALCFEPQAALAVLNKMLDPYRDRVKLLPRTRVIDLQLTNGRIESALAYNFDTRQTTRLKALYYLDATETGDLLPLAKTPYIVGSESKADTGEPHAAPAPNPACVQSFTYPFIVEKRIGEDHTIAAPPEYQRFRDLQKFSFNVNYPKEYGWKGDHQYVMYGEDPPIPNNMSPRPFFRWRRVLYPGNFTEPVPELALINWPRQDYHEESLLDRTPPDTARILQQAKRASLAFLYWLQTEMHAPELKLRADQMGTEDGLSKTPYIRESRRLLARGRVVEQDVAEDYQPGPRARVLEDSIGTGFYMVDIHPCGANERGRMMMPRPFQIPMAALLPKSNINLIAAGKNIGVTHLTNGAFRLHPVEWNVGEAAAVIASLAIRTGALPGHGAVQPELAAAGVPLVWFDDLHPSHPAFAAIQKAAVTGRYPLDPTGLHASPDAPLTRMEAAQILTGLKGGEASARAVELGLMAVDHRNWFHGDLPFLWTDWRQAPPSMQRKSRPVTRAEFATAISSR